MFAEVNGLRMFYEERGPADGEPIVFLHGFPFDHSMWQHQIEALEQTYRCIAPDLRGHGQTTTLGPAQQPGQVSIAHMAEDVIALLNDLHIQQATVCGLSMGGYIAFALWRTHAPRVRQLILADTRAGPDSEEARQNRFRLAELVLAKGSTAATDAMLPRLFAPANLSSRAAQQIRAIIERTPPAHIVNTLYALANRPDSTALLPTITVPCLVIVGEHDAITPPAEAELICQRIAGAQSPIIVPDAGHLSPLENPTAFNQALADFLRR
ncbi:MAG: alpha/beta fold hydrolase [Anaerolineae bacterium]|nr:alpha/beta fold hydrolase [Thermoflexales bacterium]MDW8407423.1 alpha/beta fold hydrolase [Anaerolineae bacterium]